MDLVLERPAQRLGPVSVEAVRPLVQADIVLLSEPRGVRAPTIKRLRDSHHFLARVLAGGMSAAEASAVTGYSSSRISILQNDPAFIELLEHYRANAAAASGELAERMGALALDVAQVLSERLEEEPEKISTHELRETLKVLADRTGHAPVSRSVNTNINVEMAARLGRARSRAGLIEAKGGVE